MASFEETAKGMPGLKDLPPGTLSGLAERAMGEVAGAHRWPFLAVAQEERTWAASDSIQSFPGILRVSSIMYPDSSSDYYRLTELSDIEFQKWIEMNPDSSEVSIWRDVGMDGDDYQIELYAVPTSAKTLKIDYYKLPNYGSIEDLPTRFQTLVMVRMMSLVGSKSGIDWSFELQRAIAREQDFQGKRWKVGRDAIQASRWRNINDPS